MSNSGGSSGRRFTHARFVEAYAGTVLKQKFFEGDAYYYTYRSRYEQTLRRLCELVLPEQCRLVEVGGGQIALLCRQMFDDEVVVWDLYDDYAGPFAEKGIGFARFDLLHDAEPPESGGFDVAVLCEVVEHLPVPAHIALAKLARSLRPGGFLLITTPNLCRVRNIVRLALGRDIFCNWFMPERGQSLGHVTEFSPERLRWQAGRAGLEVVSLERVQFSIRASTLGATLGKAVCAPLSLVPRWREGLVMVCRRPEGAGAGQPDGVAS